MKADELSDLQPGEPIESLRHHEGDLWTATAPGGWAEAARYLSTSTGGMWFFREYGLTHVCGSKRMCVVEPPQVPGIMEARLVCRDLGVDPGWSIGSCANRILHSMGRPQYAEKGAARLLSESRCGYQDVCPGEYEHCDYYDVESYYFTLLRRLPSWRVTLPDDGPPIWLGMRASEVSRRRAIEEAVGGHKRLRNAIWGCMLGSASGTTYYHKGKACLWSGRRGPFYPAACLLARSAWEITRDVAEETDSVYSYVDAVMVRDGLYPQLWDDLGFRIGTKASGPAEVCWNLCYKCGNRQSVWYQRGSRWREPLPRSVRPDHLYYRQWVA